MSPTNSVAKSPSECKENRYTLSMGFGKWLAAKREEARLTQAQLAERSGISPNYVSALEREEPNALDGSPRRPRIEKVDRMAKALGVSLDEARLAAGYAPLRNETDYITVRNQMRIILLDGEDYTTEDKAEFEIGLGAAFEVLKARIEERKHRGQGAYSTTVEDVERFGNRDQKRKTG